MSQNDVKDTSNRVEDLLGKQLNTRDRFEDFNDPSKNSPIDACLFLLEISSASFTRITPSGPPNTLMERGLLMVTVSR